LERARRCLHARPQPLQVGEELRPDVAPARLDLRAVLPSEEVEAHGDGLAAGREVEYGPRDAHLRRPAIRYAPGRRFPIAPPLVLDRAATRHAIRPRGDRVDL